MKQWLKRIGTWQQLFDFCKENGCTVCDGILTQEMLAQQVTKDIASEVVRGVDWKKIRLKLIYIEESQCYLRHHSLQYVALDQEDFEFYKSEVQAWLVKKRCPSMIRV